MEFLFHKLGYLAILSERFLRAEHFYLWEVSQPTKGIETPPELFEELPRFDITS